MHPLFKTDLWTVVNAASGRDVEVLLHDLPTSQAAYIERLVQACEFLGLERINVFFDPRANVYRIGSGSARLTVLQTDGTPVQVRQFADDDLTPLVDGRDIFERANEMLDSVDEGDDAMTEHVFYEDDENDSYGFATTESDRDR